MRAHIRTRARIIETYQQRADQPESASERLRAIIPPMFWDNWDSGEEDGFTDDSWNINVFSARARAGELTVRLCCIGVEFCETDIRSLFNLPDADVIASSLDDKPKRGAPVALHRTALLVAAILQAERKGEFKLGHDRPSNLANVLRAYGAYYSEAYLNSLFLVLAPLLPKIESPEK